jgi:6,7-dimethyl-8-ribityllumazine synthase
MPAPRTIEGNYRDAAGRVAIVASRFNDFVTDKLLAGALDCLRRHGVGDDRVDVVRVPGAWEVPLVCLKLCRAGTHASVIALGAVIRGATPHHQYVASEAVKGCAQAMMETGVPVHLGILTTDTIDQAIERAGSKAGNKGWDAALAALETMSLCAMLGSRDR